MMAAMLVPQLFIADQGEALLEKGWFNVIAYHD